MVSDEKKLRFLTKNEYAYEVLRERIINNEISPNESLIIHNLAKELGVSETPVREAIQQLSAEGLVVIIPHNGIKVAVPSLKELKQILEIRLALEILAMRLSVNNFTKEKVDGLFKLQKDLEKNTDVKQYSKLDRLFHNFIYQQCNNDKLIELINDLWSKSDRTGSIFRLFPSQIGVSLEEHKEMVILIKEEKEAQAVEVLERHRRRTFNRLIKHIEENFKVEMSV